MQAPREGLSVLVSSTEPAALSLMMKDKKGYEGEGRELEGKIGEQKEWGSGANIHQTCPYE